MTGNAHLLRANALALPIANNTIDLIVTSPPYFALRTYKDGGEHYDGQVGAEPTPNDFVDALLDATREMVRVIKPSGSIFVNLGDSYQNKSGHSTPQKSLHAIPWRYAIRCIDELGIALRSEIIWNKPNGMPDPTRDRVTRKHEYWFHFVTSTNYFANLDNIRQPHKTKQSQKARKSPPASWRGIETGRTHNDNTPIGNFFHHPKGKMATAVWNIPTQGLRVPPEMGIDHFAAFPTEWPRRLIAGWCPEGGRVLDPFGGTGTTAAVARSMGRTGITVDMSADYLRLAQWRCHCDGYDKLVRTTKPTIQPKGTPTLFDRTDQ